MRKKTTTPDVTLSKEQCSMFTENLKPIQKKLFGYLLTITRNLDLAGELYQITITQALEGVRHKLFDGVNFNGWIFRIAHNAFINHIRQTKKNPLAWSMRISQTDVSQTEGITYLLTLKDSEQNKEAQMMREELLTYVQKLIDHLPRDQKEVIRLRYYEQLSFKDIAKKTGVSINTSIGRMRYALINLRKLVNGENSFLKAA